MLTETWLDKSIDVASLLGGRCSNYVIFRCDRVRKTGGGVALMALSPLPLLLVFSESVEDSYEILCSDLQVGMDSIPFIVVYGTSSCNTTKTDQLIKVVSDLLACNRRCVLTGDFIFPETTCSQNWSANGKL